MNIAQIKVDILSYWHAGSGYGKGADCDAVVLKDATGLPYLPGRSVKGLLREGVQIAEDYGRVAAGTTDRLFGKPAAETDTDGSHPGTLAFYSAQLPDDIRAWLSGDSFEKVGQRATLFRRFSSTSLDAQGMAQDRTLRTIEVAIPITLTATVEAQGWSDQAWLDPLAKGAALVRSLGSQRHRGLGRCSISIEKGA